MSATIRLPVTDRSVELVTFVARAFTVRDRFEARLTGWERLTGKALRARQRWAAEAAEEFLAYKTRWQQWERQNPVTVAHSVAELPVQFRLTVEAMRKESL